MSGPMKKMMLSALLLSILTPVSFASSKAENEIRITYGAICNQAALIDYCRNYPIKEWLRVGFGFGANYMISWFQAEDFSGGIREDRLKPMKGDDKNLYYNLDHPGQYCPIVMESSDISFPVFGHVVIDPGKKRCSPIFEASAGFRIRTTWPTYHGDLGCGFRWLTNGGNRISVMAILVLYGIPNYLHRPIAKDKITTMFSPASGYYPSFDVVWFGAFDKKIDRLGGSAGITLSYSF